MTAITVLENVSHPPFPALLPFCSSASFSPQSNPKQPPGQATKHTPQVRRGVGDYKDQCFCLMPTTWPEAPRETTQSWKAQLQCNTPVIQGTRYARDRTSGLGRASSIPKVESWWEGWVAHLRTQPASVHALHYCTVVSYLGCTTT
jgi:hypothetical protein